MNDRPDSAEDIIVAYGQAFSSVAGQVVLEDMERSLSERLSFDSNEPDPHLTAFHEGQRSVVLLIKALMRQASAIMLARESKQPPRTHAIMEDEETD